MSFFGVQKLTYRTEVLEKAHLSADDKTKMKAFRVVTKSRGPGIFPGY